jgi:hypothetical protein
MARVAEQEKGNAYATCRTRDKLKCGNNLSAFRPVVQRDRVPDRERTRVPERERNGSHAEARKK